MSSLQDSIPLHDPEQLLPHSGQMVLIDKIIKYDEVSLTAQVVIQPDTEYLQPEGVPSWVGLEYMAQSIAAFEGIRRFKKKLPPQLGFLLGTRKLTAHKPWFELTDELHITIDVLYEDDKGMGSYRCHIFCSGELLVDAVVSAFRPNDIEQYLDNEKTV